MGFHYERTRLGFAAAFVGSKSMNEVDAYRFIQFIGDIHQPLHDENLDVGGNTIDVTFDGDSTNLHAVWDTSIPGTLLSPSSFPDLLTHYRKIRWRLQSGRRQDLGHDPHNSH